MALPDSTMPTAIKQFELEKYLLIDLLGVDVSFTNSASAMMTTVAVVALFIRLSMRGARTIPGRVQAAAECIYEFVANTVANNIGPDSRAHIPFVFTLFVFILFGSLIGLTPVKFTFTSHAIVTLGLAYIVFGYVIAYGIRAQGAGFFRAFLPEGTPWPVAPLIIVIEVISYMFRPITLGVRLFANVLAGHIIIKLFADFSAAMTGSLGLTGAVLGILPAALSVVLYGFEVVVFVIQSYVFMLLTCVYIRTSTEAH